MKALKKCMVTLLMVVFMAMILTGCAKKGECEGCGQVEKLKEFVDDDGDSYWYCEDCYRMEKLID